MPPKAKEPTPAIIRLIWTALGVAHLAYLYLAMNRSGTVRPPLPETDPTPTIFAILAVSEWLFAFFIFPKIYVSTLERKRQLVDRMNPSSAPSGLSGIFPLMIVQWVLLEAITLQGFVLAIRSGQVDPMVPFLAAGLLGHVFAYPSQARMEKLLALIAPKR